MRNEMNKIEITKSEAIAKNLVCYFHPELRASVLIVRKVAESVYLCGICQPK